jgi:hypothetical protein
VRRERWEPSRAPVTFDRHVWSCTDLFEAPVSGGGLEGRRAWTRVVACPPLKSRDCAETLEGLRLGTLEGRPAGAGAGLRRWRLRSHSARLVLL